jgi:uncharacterized Zn-finger protein
LWRAQDNPSHTKWKHGARGPEAHLSTRSRSAGGQRDASSPCPDSFRKEFCNASLSSTQPINLEFRKWVEIYLRIRSLPQETRLSLKFYVSAASFTNWVPGAGRAMLHSPPATTTNLIVLPNSSL